MGKGTKNPLEFINYVCSYTFKLQLPSKCSPFDAVYIPMVFLLKTVFELIDFDGF